MTVAEIKLLLLLADDVDTITFVVSTCVGLDAVPVCIDIDVVINVAVATVKEMEFERDTVVDVKDWLSFDSEGEKLLENEDIEPYSLLEDLKIDELESFLEVVVSINEVLVIVLEKERPSVLLLLLETSENFVVSSILLDVTLKDPSVIGKELCVAVPPIKMFKILK